MQSFTQRVPLRRKDHRNKGKHSEVNSEKERGVKGRVKHRTLIIIHSRKSKLKTVLRKKLDKNEFKTYSLLKQCLMFVGWQTYPCRIQKTSTFNQSSVLKLKVIEGTTRHITVPNSSQKSTIYCFKVLHSVLMLVHEGFL